MNHNCCGDFFRAEGAPYYRCLQDSTVIPAPKQGDKCPCCGRIIKGVEGGEAEVTMQRIAHLGGGVTVVLPSTDRTASDVIKEHKLWGQND